MYAILQRSKEVSADTATHKKPQQTTINQTGLPEQLKRGIEDLSGYSMDRVRVHYHSSNPAKLQALAYTQGMDIHVASGQERSLPHEAWHVVQQMQGRVRPTIRIKGVAVNEDSALEHEADVMGEKAIQCAMPRSVIRMQTVSKSCLQAKLPSGVAWRDIYQNIGNGEVIERGRTIQDSKDLVQSLNRFFRRTGYFKDTLENENGLRRLANDIKLVRKYVKIAQSSAAASGTGISAIYAGFAGGNPNVLKNAQHLVNNKIKVIENRKYGNNTPNYINEENAVHFNRMKQNASVMIGNVLGKNDSYLQNYFNPKNRTIPAPNLFYHRIRANFGKMNSKLPIIGFKNNYSRKRGVFAYVYKESTQRPVGTSIDGKDVSDTFIRSKINNGVETGLQIRLSSAYRRAAETGRDSKPGVIIHEASHMILGTGDLAYGNNIQNLEPDQAEKNADTYEYAAENA